MAVFACAHCGASLTPVLRFGVSSGSLPDDAEVADPTSARGTFFVDPNASAKTWDARAQEWVPVRAVGCIVCHPDDVVGVRWHRDDGEWVGCCGPDGEPEGNVVCAACGSAVGTLSADCWTALEIRLLPHAVRRTTDQAALSTIANHPKWMGALHGDAVRRALDPTNSTGTEQYASDDDDWEDDEDDDAMEVEISNLAVAGAAVWLAADNGPLLVRVDTDTGAVTTIELPNAAHALERERHQWYIPNIFPALDRIWVDDVVDGGWFVVDPLTHDVTRGDASGDRAVMWSALDGLTHDGAPVLDGAALWWCDGSDGSVRRRTLGSDDVLVTALSGCDAVYAAGGRIWATETTNIVDVMGVLHQVDPVTGAVERTLSCTNPIHSLAVVGGKLWLLGSFPADHRDATVVQHMRRTIDLDDDEWENHTLLTALDPDTFAVLVTTELEGQVHALASDDSSMWSSVFSARDQADRVIRIDADTGVESLRISLAGIDMQRYNPPAPPRTGTLADFNHVVRDLVAGQLPVGAEAALRGDELVVQQTDEHGETFSLATVLRRDVADEHPGNPEHVAELVGATWLALWDSRELGGLQAGSGRRLD
jgi:hypothetical protein